MKLKHFLQPTDSFFSTPKAVRRLLRLFAQLLVLGMVVGAIISLSSILRNEVSRRQGLMSDAIANARVFFTQREALLKSLALSAVAKPPGQQFAVAQQVGHRQPGDDLRWDLQLSGRMVDFLTTNRINLLYVADQVAARVVYLNRTVSFDTPIPGAVLSRLQRIDPTLPEADQAVWLSDQQASTPRLYLFVRVDFHQPRSGWLGMEMDASDVASTLHDDAAGQFMMLNPRGDVMMRSVSSVYPSLPLPKLETGHDFGFSGEGFWPDQLVMRKKLGYSDWKLFYAIGLEALLKVLWWPLLAASALILLIGVLVGRLVTRVERRLITPATQRIDALIESEAFNRAIIQTAPVALCVLRRADGQVVLENTLSQQWLGECKERERLCHGWIEQAFSDRELVQSDEFQAGDGRHLHLSFVRTRYNGEDVLFCAFSDISTRKQAEAAMTMAKQMADAANEAKTLFLATMSHEIRTPLYGVLGTLELLARTELRGPQKDYLHAIESSSAALLNLVCDVLDVAKIEAGQLALEASEFSPLELIHDVTQSYAGAARSKGLYLYAFVDPHMPALLRGDITRIRQVLNNLLNNAVKFTESGQIVLRAKVGSMTEERADILWQVSDSGPGIAPDDQALLFEPFYQSSTKTNVVPGTGLGLSICQRLAALMNGSIRVVSAVGLGSSFTLSIPLGRSYPMPASDTPRLADEMIYVHSPVLEMAEYVSGWLRRWGAQTHIGLPPEIQAAHDVLLVEAHPHTAHPVLLEWSGPRVVICPQECEPPSQQRYWRVKLNDLNGLLAAVSQAQGIAPPAPGRIEHEITRQLDLRVLVAEDNVINQLIVKDQLEELGCSVGLARDGHEALALWQNEVFDVVLTDINMPRMNGYDLAKALRRQGCVVPIIGATANAMRDEGDRCLAVGMQQLLVKPFGLGALFTCLQHCQREERRE